MKQPTILVIACALLITGLTSGVNAATVAKVSGVEISEAMLDAFASNRARKPAADITDDEKALLKEELIKLVAVGAEARKRKIDSDPEVAAQIKLQEYSMLAQAYIQKQLKDNPIPEQKLQALYDEKYAGTSQAEYKARHILVSSPAVAADLISQLGSGGNFADLAAKNSIGPSAKSGGDLGWFTKDSMVPAFANAVATMPSGTVSPQPVQTQYGWHVILKEDERSAPGPDLATVTPELERELQQQAVTDLVDGLREKAKVKTYN